MVCNPQTPARSHPVYPSVRIDLMKADILHSTRVADVCVPVPRGGDWSSRLTWRRWRRLAHRALQNEVVMGGEERSEPYMYLRRIRHVRSRRRSRTR